MQLSMQLINIGENMVIKCICNKGKKVKCVGHQVNPIKKRDKRMGLLGQEIWFTMQQYRFVGKNGLHYKLTPREQRIKNWLIWGKWKKDSKYKIDD